MKILKPGKNPYWSKECKCTGIANYSEGCDALLLVEEDDIYTIELGSGLDDSKEYHQVFKCPSCQAETDIKNLSRKILDKAVNRKKPLISNNK